MLDGGRVRHSLVSLMEAFPYVRIEKRKYSAIQEAKAFKNVEHHELRRTTLHCIGILLPVRSRRKDNGTGHSKGLLESLQDSCFVADGEDTSGCKYQGHVAAVGPDGFVVSMPVFTPLARKISVNYLNSGAGTPPLFLRQLISIRRQLNIALVNKTHPLSNMGRSQPRVQADAKVIVDATQSPTSLASRL
jgi:hypothetical protein